MKNDIIRHIGDCRDVLPTLTEVSINCCVTSPPYWGLRDYGVEGQIGLEATPEEYIENMVQVFREVWRVLRDDGTLWLNLGDSYANNGSGGHGATGGRDKSTLMSQPPAIGINPTKRRVPAGLKTKDLIGMPWRVALALQADGWYLRSDIVWHKPNPMPESVQDRPTKSHEYIFLLSKSEKYYYDINAIKEECSPADYKTPDGWDTGKGSHGSFHKNGREKGHKAYSFKRKTKTTPPPGQPAQHREEREDIQYSGTRNKRTVWTVPTKPYKGAHFATFPPKLIEPCILAGCPEGGTVLDLFGGSGTTAEVAVQNRRKAILIELNPEYDKLQEQRTSDVQIKMI